MAEKQLQEMLTALRAECRHSTNTAFGLNERETLVYLLDRTQLDLWESYDWPMMQADRDITLVEGQRYYAYPADMRFEDINNVWLLRASDPAELAYGITPDLFRTWDSDSGARSSPVRRWAHHGDDNTLEVWPIPDGAAELGTLRLRGTRQPAPLVNNTDTATLPWRIIVLTAAAEVLAAEEDPSAGAKAKRAAELIRRLRVRTGSHKGGVTPYGQAPSRQPRMGLDYIPPGFGQGPRRV